MKKILTFLFLAVTAMTFVSCNDDEIAATLDGVWEGEVSVGRWNSCQYVDIQFSRDQYSAGYGMEYDYQGNSGAYVECPFTFKVTNGTIFMEYDDGSRVAIRNYSLTDTHFSGDFYEWVGNYSIGSYIAHFDFYKVTSWRHSRFGGYYTAQPDSTVTIEKVESKK
ncbi:MAG: hypothetical protein IKQ47_06040 [Prevotella sp.]|nr:hypothetical protein [Prevotella sp.]